MDGHRPRVTNLSICLGTPSFSTESAMSQETSQSTVTDLSFSICRMGAENEVMVKLLAPQSRIQELLHFPLMEFLM